MAEPGYITEMEKKVFLLETQIKHLANDLHLTKEENETSLANYFEIYSHMERKVEERTQEIKKFQKALEQKGKELEMMLDVSPAMIFYKDVEQRFIRVNKKFAKTIGMRINEIIGKKHNELFPKNKDYGLKKDLEVIITGKRLLNKKEFFETRKGRRKILIDRIPYKDINRKVIGLIGFALDITDIERAEKEKKKLEKQLQQAQKMEAIGTLAGGVAHDLNNVLSGLVSYPELILIDLPEESHLRKPVVTIQKSGLKAAAIVQDLLTLARRGVSVTEVVDLNDIIHDYLGSPEHERLKSFHPHVQIETNLQTDLLNILGSLVHLSKTVMNLVSNAAEAMPDGGKISITTENRYIDKPISGYDDVEEGEYIVLIVSDTGIGMSPEDMERIFEPFYTKKVMGRSGTGLGMAVVWGTVKDHKGYIDMQSSIGEGTTFTLYFPVTRNELSKNESLLSMEDYIGKGESILVVDDVVEQRDLASVMLRKLGYSVTTVSSGEEAVEYIKDNSVDLLILDMIMDPGMDGLETYKKILEYNLVQKTIIVSGFSETDRVKEAQRLGAGTYVKKPFLLEKIGIAVRDELEK